MSQGCLAGAGIFAPVFAFIKDVDMDSSANWQMRKEADQIWQKASCEILRAVLRSRLPSLARLCYTGRICWN